MLLCVSEGSIAFRVLLTPPRKRYDWTRDVRKKLRQRPLVEGEPFAVLASNHHQIGVSGNDSFGERLRLWFRKRNDMQRQFVRAALRQELPHRLSKFEPWRIRLVL